MPPDSLSAPSNPSDTSSPSIHQIVERYLPFVRWLTPEQGLTPCPGEKKHNVKSSKRDCMVFVTPGRVPTVSCFHSSCHEEVAAVNDDIRAAWRLFSPAMSAEDQAALSEISTRRRELEARATASKPIILRDHAWSIDLAKDSDPSDFNVWKGLWRSQDIIWVGEPHESGQWFHRNCFQTAEEAGLRGHFSCASTFKLATQSRSNDSVASTPFLIVEGDSVLGKQPENDLEKRENKLACAAIFRWLEREVGLTLRCVIDSGNKSLHGWFNMPPEALYNDLKTLLPFMGCDRAMFKPSQPARVPGIMRDNGKGQNLLYFK